ncbi:MAG TPA: nitroreductase family protein [Candidatus Caccocola faecigallinarum]|nr:nitroreductase family protein [Candidatus Caccocola faecigallinarum]
MELYEAIAKRRIVRDFKDEDVPLKTVEKIIGAGLKAPTLEILKRTLTDGTPQQKMYAAAMPRQYTMLFSAPYVILPFFKTTPGVMKPDSVSSLNPLSSIWCVVENIFLAATAEGLACSMRIPVGSEGPNAALAVGAPDGYMLPCYIGIGVPADDAPEIEQIEYTAKQKVHFGKW